MMTEQNAKTIGKTLKTLRTTFGYSRRALGDILGVSYQQIQKYESGTNRLPIDALYTLKQLYNIPFEQFFDENKTTLEPALPKEALLFIKLQKMKNKNLQAKITKALEALIT